MPWSRVFSLVVWSLCGIAFTASASEPSDVVKTVDTEVWLEIRMLGDDALETVSDPAGKDVRRRAKALLTLAERNLNRSAKATLQQVDQATALLRSGSDTAVYAAALRCQAMHRQGASGNHCREFRDAAPAVAEPFVRTFVHATRSYLLYRESRHPEALDEAHRTLSLAEQLDDADLMAWANNAIGVHFSTRLLPRMALSHMETAWKYAGKMAYPEFKQVVRINLAAVYAYLDRYQEAADLLNAARKWTVVAQYPTRRLVVESLLAVSRVGLGHAAEAEKALSKILAEVNDVVLPDARAYALTALGIAQLERGNAAVALRSLKAAMKETGQTFSTGLDHPRVQFVLVPYAKALRLTGRTAEARELLESVIDGIPSEKPNQLLVEAYSELAVTLNALGDSAASLAASVKSADTNNRLSDASFEYQLARLNAHMERERRSDALALALEREAVLEERARRQSRLRYQTYMLGALLLAIGYLWFTRRLHSRLAQSERAANERLEEQVRARTREVEEQMAGRMQVEVERSRLTQQLVEGEKLRALGQLTAGIAHDFNNLMTVVTLTAESLRDEHDLEPGVRVQLSNDILAAADSGAQITSALLAYARKQTLQPSATQLDELLREAMPMLRNTLGDRFALETHFEPCRVLADRGQVITSVLNLMLNAREAMGDGGMVDLSLRARGEMAEIVVRDSGSGMSEEERERAVDPFFTTKMGGQGTGLGLSMVYGFAKQSGGDLVLESQPGEGTTARLKLPLIDSQDEPASRDFEEPMLLREDLSAMIVEDRESLLEILRRTLEMLGMRVTAARSADEALREVDANGLPELVVSDIVMPGDLDGRELAARLRQRDPTLPIVLISGYSDPVDSNFTFLSKPFSVEELKGAVLDALRLAHHSEGAAC